MRSMRLVPAPKHLLRREGVCRSAVCCLCFLFSSHQLCADVQDVSGQGDLGIDSVSDARANLDRADILAVVHPEGAMSVRLVIYGARRRLAGGAGSCSLRTLARVGGAVIGFRGTR